MPLSPSAGEDGPSEAAGGPQRPAVGADLPLLRPLLLAAAPVPALHLLLVPEPPLLRLVDPGRGHPHKRGPSQPVAQALEDLGAAQRLFPHQASQDGRTALHQELHPGVPPARHHLRGGLLCLLHGGLRLLSGLPWSDPQPGPPGRPLPPARLSRVPDELRDGAGQQEVSGLPAPRGTRTRSGHRGGRGHRVPGLQPGAALVPVFSFGENDIFRQVRFPPGSFFRRLQLRFKQVAGFAPCLFVGRSFFSSRCWGLLPQPSPITVVVGKPILVPLRPYPKLEEVEHYHALYVQALQQLFEEHKGSCGLPSSQQLFIT